MNPMLDRGRRLCIVRRMILVLGTGMVFALELATKGGDADSICSPFPKEQKPKGLNSKGLQNTGR